VRSAPAEQPSDERVIAVDLGGGDHGHGHGVSLAEPGRTSRHRDRRGATVGAAGDRRNRLARESS